MSTMAESSTDMIEALSDRSISRSSAHSPVSYGPTKLRGSKVEYSHKLTEKRRRDRMNSSMSEIAQLLPSSSPSKQLEKAEILEKTITYIKKLQEITGKQEPKTGRKSSDQHLGANRGETPSEKADSNSDYYSGFSDCIKEVFHCLTNVEAMDLQQPCFQRLMCHLQNELKFMFVERGGSEQDEHLDTSSNGDSDNVTSTRGPKTALGCKRSHDSIEAGTPQEPHSSFNPAKRQHISDYNNCSESTLCSRESDISLSSLTPQETMSPSSSGTGGNGHSKKEKQKAVLNGVSFWIGSGSPLSNPESSSDKEKREGLSPSTNMFDKVNGEGSGCVNEAVGGSHKWQNNGLDLPVVATPIPPRTPYISNPYTVPTYALHPSGTHYIPVVLHMNIAPPSLPEINGSFNPVANMAALTFMRMGGLHYPPYFPCGVPFVPPVSSGINGVNGLHNPKQESTQKQCVSKSREVDSSTSVLESHSGNECSTTDTLIL